MQRLSGLSLEILGHRLRRQLTGRLGWLIVGAIGPALIVTWVIVKPFDIREALYDFRRAALLLCLWYAAFAVAHVLYVWLQPRRGEDDDLATTPLPALQFFLHRAVAACAVPLTAMVLTLPLYAVLLMYVGDPYSSGSQDVIYSLRPEWDWASFPNPWSWRVFFIGLNVIAATLLPLSMSLLLREVVPWRSLRIPLFVALPAALWYAVARAELELLRRPYRMTRELDPWAFLITLISLLALFVLMGWLKPRLRLVASLVLGMLLAVGAILAVREGDGALAGHIVGPVRDVLGDGRYALAYFFGHLSLDKNIDLLLTKYQSTILFASPFGGESSGRRLSIWVGAGIYPPAIAMVSFVMLALGTALRGGDRPHRD